MGKHEMFSFTDVIKYKIFALGSSVQIVKRTQ